MNDIMVDLETLDTKPSAIILSIGACRINWVEETVDMPFHQVISIDSCKAAGLTESPSTVAWWNQQSSEARSVFTDPNVPLLDALAQFSAYMKEFDHKNVRLWGNGSDFDNTILANAYAAMGFEAPWRFYNNRCFRTVKDMYSDMVQKLPRQGTHHNALDDALHQARELLQIRNSLFARRIRSM